AAGTAARTSAANLAFGLFRVTRAWRETRHHDPAAMVVHLVVQVIVRGRVSGIAVRATSTAAASTGAAIQYDAGSARQRAHAHRAGFARHESAELPGRITEVSGIDLYDPETPCRRLRNVGGPGRRGLTGDRRRPGSSAGAAILDVHHQRPRLCPNPVWRKARSRAKRPESYSLPRGCGRGVTRLASGSEGRGVPYCLRGHTQRLLPFRRVPH